MRIREECRKQREKKALIHESVLRIMKAIRCQTKLACLFKSKSIIHVVEVITHVVEVITHVMEVITYVIHIDLVLIHIDIVFLLPIYTEVSSSLDSSQSQHVECGLRY